MYHQNDDTLHYIHTYKTENNNERKNNPHKNNVDFNEYRDLQK